MALANYSDLQALVAGYLKRGNLTTEIKDFIALAEAHMNRELRTRNQEVRETFTLSTEYTDLTGLTNTILELRNVQLNTNPVRVLEYRSPHQIDKEYPQNEVGKPVYYTLIGDELQVRPVPDSSYTAELAIIAPLSALSDANTTNWFMTNHPDMYLAGSLYYANKYIKDNQEAMENLQTFSALIKSLNKQEKRARYSGSPLKSRPRSNP